MEGNKDTEKRDSRLDTPADFEGVLQYATTPEGFVDLRTVQELEGRYGYNGGMGCDVLSGPCSCGAWH